MEPFKTFISPQVVACIADQLEKHVAGFERSSFEDPILADLPSLELKDRVRRIAEELHRVLPSDLTERNRALLAMLHPNDDIHTGGQSDEHGIRGWGTYPLTMVVGRYGLEDFDGSMQVLKEMTKRFSAEFDVRPFILADQERALSLMGSWVSDRSLHVRRLVSEGTRPRLPWGERLPALIADPSPVLPLLTALRDDEEEYVRRSVANHLNDIAKDHPDLVADLAAEWLAAASEPRKKLVRHACRTLIKQGHSGALKAFGLGPPKVELQRIQVENEVIQLGETLRFSIDLRSEARSAQDLIIDYVMHFKKANGSQSGKVFKWKKLTLEAGESIRLERAHGIRAITTRRYYDGRQGLSMRINGQDFGWAEFELEGCSQDQA